MTGDIPFEMEAFQVSFLPSELRKVRRDASICSRYGTGLMPLQATLGAAMERWSYVTILVISQ